MAKSNCAVCGVALADDQRFCRVTRADGCVVLCSSYCAVRYFDESRSEGLDSTPDWRSIATSYQLLEP